MIQEKNPKVVVLRTDVSPYAAPGETLFRYCGITSTGKGNTDIVFFFVSERRETDT